MMSDGNNATDATSTELISGTTAGIDEEEKNDGIVLESDTTTSTENFTIPTKTTDDAPGTTIGSDIADGYNNGTVDTCVPYYCNDTYGNDCIYNNYWGSMSIMKCSDYQHDVYHYPKAIISSTKTRFECCKETPSMSKNVLVAYKRTTWPILAVSLVSLLTSTLLIVALILPLIIQKFTAINRRSGTSELTTATNSTGVTRRLQQRQQRQQQQPTSATRNTNDDRANAFNMYLVYLSIPDVIFNTLVTVRCCMMLALEGGVDGWTWINWIDTYDENKVYGTFVVISCNASSLYINSVIVHEVYQLLKKSNQSRRQPPPTLKKAFCQAITVYICSSILSIIVYFTKRGWETAIIAYTISTGIPMVYVIYICYSIKRYKLVTKADRHLKVLAVYFFRIVLVFVFIWGPGMLLLALSYLLAPREALEMKGKIYASAFFLFCAQGMVSFMMALLKPDVKQAVMNVLTLSICNCPDISTCSGGNRTGENAEAVTNGVNNERQENRTTVPRHGDQDVNVNNITSIEIDC